MAVKMIALRAVYRQEERKEYAKGEPFTVETQDEADRLIRRRKAELAGKGRPLKKNLTAQAAPSGAPLASSGQGRQTYNRRDMVAETPKEDGQTGQDTQSE